MAQAERQTGWRGSAELWLDAAYAALVEGGVEAVRLGALSERLGLSRTSFYGHFASREALLAALVERWAARNTGAVVARCEAYAETVAEALLNLFDCWLDPALFDARLDRAVRNWALGDEALRAVVAANDRTRIAAIEALFLRFGRAAPEAEVRAFTVYYTQIGYIALAVAETPEVRMARMPLYVATFAGVAPTGSEVARFRARHGG